MSSRRGHPFRAATRSTARAFTVLAVLALLLAGASGWLSVRAVQGEIASRATILQLCQTSNDFRAGQVTLWTHLIAISTPPPHETAAQKQQRQVRSAAFLRYIRHVFAPRDCAANYDG